MFAQIKLKYLNGHFKFIRYFYLIDLTEDGIVIVEEITWRSSPSLVGSMAVRSLIPAFL